MTYQRKHPDNPQYQRIRPDVTDPISVGDRFGRWTVIDAERVYQKSGNRNRPFLWCRCDCGTEKLVSVVSLRHKQGSCGCGQREWASERFTKDGIWKESQKNRRSMDSVTPFEPLPVKRVRNGKEQEYWVRGWHGESKTPLYRRWLAMRRRCSPTGNANSRFYGDRGIRVCAEWDADFFTFKAWALSNGYDPKLEIDRLDPDGDYCPENCRWVTKTANIKRKRVSVNEATIMSRIRDFLDTTDSELQMLRSEALASFLQERGF
jgi:hypothetical protein